MYWNGVCGEIGCAFKPYDGLVVVHFGRKFYGNFPLVVALLVVAIQCFSSTDIFEADLTQQCCITIDKNFSVIGKQNIRQKNRKR